MSTPVLSARALNRATLARQLLMAGDPRKPLDAVRHLVGLQAQVPHDPYTALWSRLERFRPESLSELLEQRALVRIGVMRGTIHLVTAEDCLLLRPLVQRVFEGQLWRHRDYAPHLRGLDLEPIVAAGEAWLEKQPRTGKELRALFAERFPSLDSGALVYACQMRLPLVQPPPRGLWRRSSQVTWTTAESWLGQPLAPSPSPDEVVLRYLAAFGPAAVADVTAWSRLTGLREVLERLRPRLVTFRDERGRELFDVPEAPRPDPASPVPVRFLPEYDNILLSHENRSRFFREEERALLAPMRAVGWGSVLHDGLVRAMWRRLGDELVVRHVPLPERALATVGAEGRRLARFLAVGGGVRLEPLGR